MEHRGLDHAGVMRDCLQEWHFCGGRDGFVPALDEDGITLYQGDALNVLAAFPEDSVDCVVTSPPYWSLRSYAGEGERIWGGDPAHAHIWQVEPIRGEGYTGTARWQHTENGRGEQQPDGKRLREDVSRKVRPEAWSTDLGTQHWCACGAWRGAYGLEPDHDCGLSGMVRLRSGLTPDQRAYVARRLLDVADLGGESDGTERKASRRSSRRSGGQDASPTV